MTQPEGRLSRRILQALRARGAFAFKVHGGPTMMAGLPDIVGVYRGYSIWLEVKMPGEEPTPIQRQRIQQIRKAGGDAFVVYSVEDAVRVLRHIDKLISDT